MRHNALIGCDSGVYVSILIVWSLRRPCLSRDDFIIDLDKFEYDVKESECEPFTRLKGFF